MGKAAKWLRLLLSGKKERDKSGPSPVPAETWSGPVPTPPPREKKRWSFRRSVTGTAMEQKSAPVRAHVRGYSDSDMYPKQRPAGMAGASGAASDAVVAAAQAAAAVIRLTNRATETVEEAAAIKIQSVFRSYLARKALCALKGLVKLQALIRGHLVRQQTTATLLSMHAMVTAQARARTRRIRTLEESHGILHQRHSNYRRSPHEARSRDSFEVEDNIKIVEMDIGESRASSKSRNSYPFVQAERRDQRLATYSASSTPYKRDPYREASPARSTLTDRSPRARSGHLGEYFITQEISPPYSIHDAMNSSLAVSQDCPLVPSYMANTESSRAKARSHSAPKQRPDSYERPPHRRRPSVEGRGIPRGHPWSIKLDRSSVSLQESECGSTSTVLTNTKYARSLMAYETVVSYL